MSDPYLADFYHGWMIEITSEEVGVRCVCYSPTRQRLTDYRVYACDGEAIAAGKQLINKQMTSSSLTQFLRAAYEAKLLSFDEWRSLHQSLNTVLSIR